MAPLSQPSSIQTSIYPAAHAQSSSSALRVSSVRPVRADPAAETLARTHVSHGARVSFAFDFTMHFRISIRCTCVS